MEKVVVKKVRKSRKYLGVMPNDGPKEDRAFNKAHLNAYLAGKSSFYKGFDTDKLGNRFRVIHLVQQEFVEQ